LTCKVYLTHIIISGFFKMFRGGISIEQDPDGFAFRTPIEIHGTGYKIVASIMQWTPAFLGSTCPIHRVIRVFSRALIRGRGCDPLYLFHISMINSSAYPFMPAHIMVATVTMTGFP
jgi:hypothetical protein